VAQHPYPSYSFGLHKVCPLAPHSTPFPLNTYTVQPLDTCSLAPCPALGASGCLDTGSTLCVPSGPSQRTVSPPHIHGPAPRHMLPGPMQRALRPLTVSYGSAASPPACTRRRSLIPPTPPTPAPSINSILRRLPTSHKLVDHKGGARLALLFHGCRRDSTLMRMILPLS
jgi:hypothetical protein